MSDVFDDSNTDSIRAGREGDPFVQTPEWILVSGISAPAQALYTSLLAHVNHARDDRKVWPGMELLAELLGFKTRRSIAKYMAELKELGAVDVERQRGTTRRRNIYTVHKTPPAGYVGMRSLSEFHAARRARKPFKLPTGTQVSLATDTAAPLATGTTGAHNQTNQTTRSQLDELTSSDAVTANPQRTSSSGEMKIYIKDDYWTTDKGHMMQTLSAALIRTLEHAKLELRPEARDRLREMLKEHATEDNHRWMLTYVRYLVSCEEQWSWFAYPPQSEAA